MARATEIINAFEELAYTSESASSSARTKKAPYDVFISHHGRDVKQTLASTLYYTLDSMGLRVFLDVEALEPGDGIPDQIEDAMRTSLLHIAIFSPNYAKSTWCLAELAFMLKTGNRLIPVFYNVEPSVLQKVTQGKGIYADALSEHKAKGTYSSEKLEEWKMALYRVSFYSGQILKNNDDQRRLLKSIVNSVSKDLKKVVQLEVAKHPVGLEEAVKDFEESAFESFSNVQIVGIVGMGGSGKTTLAKELYNRKFSSFDRCSFLFDVRDTSEKKNLHNKQKKLLEDLNLKDLPFDSVEEGKQILASRLRSLSLFIILDDINHKDQLDALLPGIDRLGWGSLILVTSRDMGVLQSWGVSSIYKMKGLNPDHARQLLCWHAFLQPFPLEGFEDLIEKFVDFCNGLPLSLKVFGGQLYGNPKNYWESQLNKISRLLHKDIKESLKISYEALDEEEQEMFLDTACFFIGEENSLAIAVWDGSGWSGLHSWQTLVNKCLVEVDENNCIRMHDHLRDLGKEIAIRQSPYRIWLSQQIINIKREAKTAVVIRGIIAESTEFHEEFTVPCWFTPACWSNYKIPIEECMEIVRSSCRKFRSFKPPSLGLELLVARDYYFAEEFARQATDLIWLRWFNFQQRTLPSWLSLKNLRVLELHNAENLKELWRDNTDPALELRELIITGGSCFLSFPRSIGCLKNLKKISVRAIDNAVPMGSLPESFCFLQSLEHLQLRLCTSITSLPTRFGDLKNMRHLDLSYCYELRMLPVSFKQLIHLEYISLESCPKLIITLDILENMTKLEILIFSQCSGLQALPRITNQRSLRQLYVDDTGLRELPSNMDQLSKLELLEIGSDLLTSLPTSLGSLLSLTSLQIKQCNELESLPNSIGNLSSLTSLQILECRKLESLPDSIGGLNLLEHLEIGSTKLKSLPKALAQLSKLQRLHIFSCPISELALGSGPFSSSFCSLKSINLSSTLVSRISISQQLCPSLETLQLSYNDHLTEIETLPISVRDIGLNNCKMLKSMSRIRGLVNLQKLVICRCHELEELPCFTESVNLKEFHIEETAGECKKIEGLEHCTSLETLKALTQWKVAAIHRLEHMERLRTLELSAFNISAVEPCLHTITREKWPSQTTICARMESDVDSIVKSFAFHGLSLVDSFSGQKAGSLVRLKRRHKRSFNAAGMVCFVISSFSEAREVHLATENGSCRTSSVRLEKGRWVWISVFTHASWLMAEEYQLNLWPYHGDADVSGTLVMGEQERIVEGFYKLLVHCGKSRVL